MWVRLNTIGDTYATKADLAKSEGGFEKSIGNLKGEIGKLNGEVSTIKKLVFGILAAVIVAAIGAVFANMVNLA